MTNPQMLVTGGSGYLGGWVARLARTRWDVTATYLTHPVDEPGAAWRRLDVRDESAVMALVDAVRPAVIVHTAAANPGYGGADFEAVNTDGSGHVARAAAACGARLVHISTDVLFDGKQGNYAEDDPPVPITSYGRSKALAEAAYDGTREVWGAVLASTLTTAAVFVPVLTVQEEAGQLFRDIAIALSFAVGLSLIVSITVIPSLSAKILHTFKPSERRFGFHRVGCFSNAAPAMAPPGGAAVWVEFTHNPHRPIDRKAARRAAVEGLKAMGWLRSRRDIATEWLLDMPHAYVTFDAHHRRATRAIHRWLARHDIHAIGRYGRWEYSAMEDALRHGRDAAGRLLGLGPKPDGGAPQ